MKFDPYENIPEFKSYDNIIAPDKLTEEEIAQFVAHGFNYRGNKYVMDKTLIQQIGKLYIKTNISVEKQTIPSEASVYDLTILTELSYIESVDDFLTDPLGQVTDNQIDRMIVIKYFPTIQSALEWLGDFNNYSSFVEAPTRDLQPPVHCLRDLLALGKIESLSFPL